MKSPKKLLLADKTRLQAAEQVITSSAFQDVVHTALLNLTTSMPTPNDATTAISQAYMLAGARRLIAEFDNIITEAEPKKPLSTGLEPEPRIR